MESNQMYVGGLENNKCQGKDRQGRAAHCFSQYKLRSTHWHHEAAGLKGKQTKVALHTWWKGAIHCHKVQRREDRNWDREEPSWEHVHKLIQCKHNKSPKSLLARSRENKARRVFIKYLLCPIQIPKQCAVRHSWRHDLDLSWCRRAVCYYYVHTS